MIPRLVILEIEYQYDRKKRTIKKKILIVKIIEKILEMLIVIW